ncbi:tail fiber protein [Gordonia phage GMA2]|uniref:Tail fiber protein n=1 Tax=Gordonia phage GMA2 TaxID=1647283 RepID=A0A0K0N7D7_9CAUD|nr:tail fiber protein [Gordonia phage GMA2]AKJ72571.1 hypothetical protein GMA2_33 [Gordonia phage GMA2]
MTSPEFWYAKGDKGDPGIQGPPGEQGDEGPSGPPNSLSVGTVTKVPAGGSPSASIGGSAPNQTVNFGLVTGDKGDKGDQGNAGPASALSLGATNTGAPGTNAIVELTGSAPRQVISFTIPRGAKGDKGDQGNVGPEGPRGYGIIANAGTPTVTEPSGPPEEDLIWYLDTITGEFWIWVETSPETFQWVHQPERGSVKGTQGIQGPPGEQGDGGPAGPPNSLDIGTVTPLATGANPTASITGEAPEQTLNLGLPAGPKGDKGDKGDAGEVSTAALNTAVNNAVAALVDGSPGALDTLNELAAALGDDPNFATTMTNALAAKAALTDPRFTDQRVPTDASVTQAKLAPNGGFFNVVNMTDAMDPGYTFGKGNWIIKNNSDPDPANHFLMYIIYGANAGESAGDISARGAMLPLITGLEGGIGLGDKGTISIMDNGVSTTKLANGSVTAAKIAASALPMDMSFIVFGKDTARAAGTGDNPFGHKFQRNVTIQSITFRCLTADASGNLVVEIRKNGSAVSGTSTTIAAANQVGGATTGSLSVNFSAGDIITIYVTGVGTTPGKGLVADIKVVCA